MDVIGKFLDQNAKPVLAYITRLYLARVKQCSVNLHLCEDTLMSGWTCLMFLLSLSSSLAKSERHKIDWHQAINRSINFVLLYMMIDHYMDAPTVKKADKERLYSWLLRPGQSSDPFYSQLLNVYLQLVNTARKTELTQQLVKIIIQSVKVEKKHRSMKEHLMACEAKGGWTVYTGAVLVYGEKWHKDDLMLLGGYLQLLDDMTDLRQDLHNGIHTPCTFEWQEHKSLDRFAIHLAKVSKNLPSYFYLYTKFIQLSILYIVSRSDYYSPKLKTRWMITSTAHGVRRKGEAALRELYKDVNI